MAYLSGSEQTTITASITELFPALWFNSKKAVRPNVKTMTDFIMKVNLRTTPGKKAFLDRQDTEQGETYIRQTFSVINPKMLQEKMENAVAITNYIIDSHQQSIIKQVIWGYRKKPAGVPKDHAGDIFLMFQSGDIIGVSLKAGGDKTQEPKFNTYVGTTLRQDYFKQSSPNAERSLKKKLWKEVYSKVGAPKSVTEENYYVVSGKQTKTNKVMVESLVKFWTKSGGDKPNNAFDKKYQTMAKVCREELCKVVNKDVKATKEWILKEFRLQTPQKVPLILVKAVGLRASEQGDPLPNFLPKVTKVKAYLNPTSVQEWFIDLMTNKKKMTLLMTIRSDAGFRPDKPKGKIGKFNMLKLLYRGVKK
jgi:hypothetical protein